MVELWYGSAPRPEVAASLEKQQREAVGASLLAVYGTWQCEGEVRHLVAQRLVDMSHLLGGFVCFPNG